MSAHGAAGFAQQSSSLGSLTADIAGFASSVPSPRLATPPLLSSPPALPGLRGGMQDVDDWGRPDVHHHYDLSTLIADRPAQQAAEDGAALILVNFELPRDLMERLWFNATIRVCADGAINRLYATFDSEEERARFIPEYVRGDLDSVEQKVLDYYAGHGTLIIKDTDQDTTDLEKCILLILDNSTAYPQRQVVVLGAFGGRLDHEFSHYHVLFKYGGIKLVLLTPGRAAFVLVQGRHVIQAKGLGRSCGLIPLAGPARRVWTTGLEWNLDGQEASALSFGTFISTSNRICAQAERVQVNTSAPLLW
eukprot:CAMPEP_0179439846 /NCGR_PEP_ID=MMETSP0799-20121207/23462_1 /TAXON_ID=46947 /ORGANISM="Geminigera cryophila, Strain CCMP2564" /LENGTH=306 /DNA_ID=CAMNT_0021222637 /DNA_START=177 /DNA_END=1094 /DNA_ORIENTATION=+